MEGNAAYEPAPGYEDRQHFIGPVNAPLWVGRKGDVKSLISDEFRHYFYAWRVFNAGGGWPEQGAWTDQDPDVVTVLVAFEEQYRAHFSSQRVLIDIQSAVFKALTRRRPQ